MAGDLQHGHSEELMTERSEPDVFTDLRVLGSAFYTMLGGQGENLQSADWLAHMMI